VIALAPVLVMALPLAMVSVIALVSGSVFVSESAMRFELWRKKLVTVRAKFLFAGMT
jgi:hypothetical protein